MRSFSPWHSSHSSVAIHASQSSPSPPWPRPEFSLDLTRHANACFGPSPRRRGICLSNDVRRSDVDARINTSPQCTIQIPGQLICFEIRVCAHIQCLRVCLVYEQPSLSRMLQNKHTVPRALPATDEPLLAHSFRSSPRTSQTGVMDDRSTCRAPCLQLI